MPRSLLSLWMVLAICAAGLRAEPAWVAEVREGTLAFARLDVPAGQAHFDRAVTAAPFGEEDARFPILLYNRATSVFCCGGSSKSQDRAATDLLRAGELIVKFGVDLTPDYAVILWHNLVAETRRCGDGYRWNTEGECLSLDRIERVVKVLEAAAPAFAREVTWSPGDSQAGLRVTKPEVPDSWMVSTEKGVIWPRAMVLSDFLDPPLVARRVFPSMALDFLADHLVERGEKARAEEIFATSANLVEKALGRTHPRTVRAWYDYSRKVKSLFPKKAAEVLGELVETLAESLEDPDHADLISFLVLQAEAQELAGDPAAAEVTLRRAGRAVAKKVAPSDYSRRLHVDLAGSNSRSGIPLGDSARAAYWQMLGEHQEGTPGGWDAYLRAFEIHMASGKVFRALGLATRLAQGPEGQRAVSLLQRALESVPAKSAKYPNVRKARTLLEKLQ